ncbi:tRNA-dihydrouridine synthase [Sphingobium cloacae]|uniref:tRNA-dihydrouridine synthase n=2 Tax=Sphingobium cloacae TaxID=120107 RepID=A0A1E1F494_9SPHN|nr:tRNA-dihydrouridine synthase [Sphingobium cloacae]
MGKSSDVVSKLAGVFFVLLVLGWFLGAENQAVQRHCYPAKASEREAFGWIDYIATGWDWPIHWLRGTSATPIPCKPGVIGLGQGVAPIPGKGMVGEILRENDGRINSGELTGSLPGSDPSIGHRNLDRYMVEHSGNPSSTQGTPSPAGNAGADQGLTPEARALLAKRLKEEQ